MSFSIPWSLANGSEFSDPLLTLIESCLLNSFHELGEFLSKATFKWSLSDPFLYIGLESYMLLSTD